MDEDKADKNSKHGDSNQLDTNDQTSAGPPTNSSRHASSSPIEIRQSQGSKFGVLHARYPPDPGCLTDKNGEPVPIDKIIKAANTMSNIMMAHKIALEDDFRLEPGMDIKGPLMSLSPIIGSSPSATNTANSNQAEPSLQSRVKNIVHEAYWDLFKEELMSQSKEDGEKKYEMSKQLLIDISQKIVELLLPQHLRLKQDIEDRLDPKIIDQLIKANTLDLTSYAKYILDLLSKLCAPVRDDKLRELRDTTDTVQVYRGIMELLELMRLDFANFTLNRFKPHIKAHSQEYEREKFNEILKHQKSIGIDGLEYTKVWLERAVKKVDTIYGLAEIVNETSSANNEDLSSTSVIPPDTSSKDVSSGTKPMSLEERILRSDVINKSLNVAYCELLEWTPTTQKLYPETLLFDEATFNLLSEQYRVLLMTSSILLTTFAFITKFKLQDDQEFRILIKSHVITLLTASYTNQSQASGSAIATNTSQKSTSSIEEQLDSIKLDTIYEKLCDDIRQKLNEVNPTQIETFLSQKELLKRQISDLQSSSNRVRELARRRITEFVETLLMLDVHHQKKKFSSKHAPSVSIPLGLNCLADEITLTMAQLVKLVRYNRTVFFHHYQQAIVDIVKEHMK